MIEQIKALSGQFNFMRVLLGLMAGTTKPKALQDWLMEQMNEDEPPAKHKKYKDLEGQDKEAADVIISAFTQLSGIFDDAIDAKAVMCYKFYKSLQKAGFSESEALQIVASQGVDMLKASAS